MREKINQSFNPKNNPMLYILLSIDYSEIVIPAIIGLVIWFYLIRTAVRADTVVRNQELIIHALIQLYKKQGATEEEMKQLDERIKR